MSYGQPCSRTTAGPPAGPTSAYPTSRTPAAICLTRVARTWLTCVLRRRRRAGGGEEVDEQLVDALGLVVVDPVRGVGQALDVVEVGHVVVVGLGERGAEVAVLFAPDDQRGRRDGP